MGVVNSAIHSDLDRPPRPGPSRGCTEIPGAPLGQTVPRSPTEGFFSAWDQGWSLVDWCGGRSRLGKPWSGRLPLAHRPNGKRGKGYGCFRFAQANAPGESGTIPGFRRPEAAAGEQGTVGRQRRLARAGGAVCPPAGAGRQNPSGISVRFEVFRDSRPRRGSRYGSRLGGGRRGIRYDSRPSLPRWHGRGTRYGRLTPAPGSDWASELTGDLSTIFIWRPPRQSSGQNPPTCLAKAWGTWYGPDFVASQDWPGKSVRFEEFRDSRARRGSRYGSTSPPNPGKPVRNGKRESRGCPLPSRCSAR